MRTVNRENKELTDKGNNGGERDARGENTKINYGMDTRGEKKKRMSKKNVDGRSTSSHDKKKFRNREEWRLVSGRRWQLL
jgi:hypothetical protein